MNDQVSSEQSLGKVVINLELENRQGSGLAILERSQIGDFLVGGEGSVFSSQLNGLVRWDLHQEPGEDAGASQLRGIIMTDDDYQIYFDAVGTMSRDDPSRPTIWFAAASVQFKSDSDRYSWLNGRSAALTGEYDLGSGRHSYLLSLESSG
ncbi:MAG: hypothetical protein ACK2T3_13765 [Candidatus Promineifilaceae bacterium]